MSKKKPINVVLSGGSARGLAHLGVLSVLEEHFQIDSIIGTSMGATIGGFYSYGYTIPELIDLVKDIKHEKLFSLFKPSFNLSGLLNGKALLKYFQDKTKNVKIENCRINFAAVSFDLNSAHTVLIDKGSLAKALRASSSLPLLIEPFKYGKYLFVDGYIEQPLPLRFANHFNKNIIAASTVFPPLPQKSSLIDLITVETEEDLPSMFNTFFKSTLYNQGAMAIQAAILTKPDIYISSFAEDLNFWELDEVDEFFKIGKNAAEKAVYDYFEDKDHKNHQQFFNELNNIYTDVMDFFKTFKE